jgi:hypothetical protein
MSRALPPHPNLEHLKKQAKERLPEPRRQHPDAKLADAQHAVAREYGFLNWPALKGYVETVAESAGNAGAAPKPGGSFVGRWTANIAKSRRHPANLFQHATVDFARAGDVLTITDVVIDETGRETRTTNAVHVDGVERRVDHGYVVVASWQGSHALEVVMKKDDEVIGRALYSVSSDGQVLTTSDLSGEHVIVLDRA